MASSSQPPSNSNVSATNVVLAVSTSGGQRWHPVAPRTAAVAAVVFGALAQLEFVRNKLSFFARSCLNLAILSSLAIAVYYTIIGSQQKEEAKTPDANPDTVENKPLPPSQTATTFADRHKHQLTLDLEQFIHEEVYPVGVVNCLLTDVDDLQIALDFLKQRSKKKLLNKVLIFGSSLTETLFDTAVAVAAPAIVQLLIDDGFSVTAKAFHLLCQRTDVSAKKSIFGLFARAPNLKFELTKFKATIYLELSEEDQNDKTVFRNLFWEESEENTLNETWSYFEIEIKKESDPDKQDKLKKALQNFLAMSKKMF